MKSLEIVGSNNTTFTYIIDNQVEEILKKYKLQYDLYKKKYYLENNINENECKHLIKQLIDTFYIYDNNKKFEDNINLFIIHLNNCHNENIYYIVYSFLNNNQILNNLTDILKKILSIFNLSNINIDSNIYLNLIYLITLIENKYPDIDLTELKQSVDEFNSNIDILQILKLKSKLQVINSTNTFCNLLHPFIENIDLLLNNYNLLKGNILKIEYNINIITKNLNNIYLDIIKND